MVGTGQHQQRDDWIIQQSYSDARSELATRKALKVKARDLVVAVSILSFPFAAVHAGLTKGLYPRQEAVNERIVLAVCHRQGRDAEGGGCGVTAHQR